MGGDVHNAEVVNGVFGFKRGGREPHADVRVFELAENGLRELRGEVVHLVDHEHLGLVDVPRDFVC